jgi:SAM-dependent methyltransferase
MPYVHQKRQKIIDELLAGMGTLKAIDVGCGSSTEIRLPSHAYIVGIDISDAKIKENLRLNEKICADIQEYAFVSCAFDVAVCCYILEHLSNPQKVLSGVFNTVKEGGIVIILVPDVYSLLGLMTKFTPLWLHEWVTRNIFGAEKDAQDQQRHWKTYMRFFIAPGRLKRFAREHGMSVTYEYRHCGAMYENIKHQGIIYLWQIFNTIIQVFSFGKMHETGTYFLILRKNASLS